MQELAAALVLAVFTAGIALTFYVADRDTPTSRALAVMFSFIAAIFVSSRNILLDIGYPNLEISFQQ